MGAYPEAVNDPFGLRRDRGHVDAGVWEPLLAFCHNGDDNYQRLRGLAAFEMWQALGRKVSIGSDLKVGPPTRLLIAAPANPAIADAIEKMYWWPDTCVAVDIAFPLLWIASARTDDEGMEFWSDPANREQALRAIRAADVVTTPRSAWFAYPEWIDELAEYNPNVVVLPDLDGECDDSIRTFAANLQCAWQSGLASKAARIAARPKDHIDRR